MGRTSKNIKLRIPEKPRKIKGFRLGSYRVATTISSRARYDHFDTSPYRACLTGAYLFYHAMTENTSAFSEIVIIFISPERHPADNGLPHSGKA